LKEGTKCQGAVSHCPLSVAWWPAWKGIRKHPGENGHMKRLLNTPPLFIPAASAHLVVQPFLPLPLFCDSPPLSLNWDRTSSSGDARIDRPRFAMATAP